MRHGNRLISLLLASLLVTPVAWAQETPNKPNDLSIVVTGKRQAPIKKAERFVRQVISMDTGQLARFLDPVCPRVLGVPQSKASAIEDRIRRNAAAARVPLGSEQCNPNLVVVVAADTDGFVRTMRKRHASFFDDLSDADLREAFRSGSVRAWRLIEERNEDGGAISGVSHANSGSMFSLPTQAATVNAVVVLDRKVVLDKTIAQIADYVTMRALVGARPPKEGAAITTILALFDPDVSAPKELTSMDAGLLAGLYAIDGTGHATGQLHRISREMVRGSGKPREARD